MTQTQFGASTDAGVDPVIEPIKVMRSAPSNLIFQQLIRQFELAIAESAAINELFARISQIVCGQSECLALWAAQADKEGKFPKVHSLTDENANAVWEAVSATGQQLIVHAQQSRQICSTPLPFQDETQLVVAPINPDANPEGKIELVLLGCFLSQNHSVLRLQWLMGIVSQSVTNWFQTRVIAQAEAKQKMLMDGLAVVKLLDQTSNQSQAAMIVVNQLRRLCQAEQVSLTIAGKLVALSDVEQVETSNESNKLIELACNQAEKSGVPILFLNNDGHTSAEELSLESYCRANRVEACLNLPLCTADGRTIGGLLIGGTAKRIGESSYVEYAKQLTLTITGHLDVVLRANRGVLDIIKLRVKSLRTHKWQKPVAIGAAVLAVVLSMPLPYRVGCDCEVQPVLRRYVAAPFEGILERTVAKNGEIVSQNQLLAELDGRSLRMELSGLQAELAGAKTRRESSLAQGDIAHSKIARSEMERFEAKIQLLEQRTHNLEIRSPIDGIIVSGDLENVEGAPLEMGQTLFEVAPLDAMVSEIAIPESEIQYVKPGMEVAIKLSAFPFRTWTGTIKRIHPRTEIVEDNSVFIAEVDLPNDGVDLRPGMKGSAKISSQWAPFGWNLFHRSWEAVRYWTIW